MYIHAAHDDCDWFLYAIGSSILVFAAILVQHVNYATRISVGIKFLRINNNRFICSTSLAMTKL